MVGDSLQVSHGSAVNYHQVAKFVDVVDYNDIHGGSALGSWYIKGRVQLCIYIHNLILLSGLT